MPGVITSISPSSKRRGRFDLVVDQRPFALLSIDAIERLRLAVGSELDARAALAVEREATLLRTYDRAADLLATRARSAADLRRLLIRKGEPADHVAAAIEKLIAAGYLDDAEFARQFARNKVLGAGLSRRRLQQELSRRGVAREVADEAIDDVVESEGVDDERSIERVARKKYRSLAKLDAPARRRRLYAFLVRRGFESEDILRVMRELERD